MAGKIVPISLEDIQELYVDVTEAAVMLKEDPVDEGEYAGLLYIQESLARCNGLMEKMTSIQIRINITLSDIERSLAAWRLIEKIFKRPDSYNPEQVAKVRGESTMQEVMENLERFNGLSRSLHLLDDTVKHRIQCLRRVNSDIRLQQKVLDDQIYLTEVGRNTKSGLRARLSKKVEPSGSAPKIEGDL